MEYIDTGIAAVAFGLAVWVFVRDSKRAEKHDSLAAEQVQLAKRLGAIEEDKRNEELESRQRAVLSVRLLARPTTTTHRYTYHWVIANDGQADAHDVYFEAHSTNKNATGKLSYRKTQEFPIRLISGNGGTYEFDAMPKQEPPPFDVVLKWRDGEGEHESDHHVSLEYQT